MKDESEIFPIVQRVVAEKLEVGEETITMDADFRNELKVSSIVIVSIVLALETEFDVEVDDEEIVKLATVGDAVRFIAQKLNAQ